MTRVHITVPASTLSGAEEEPGDLASYGPIPAGMAREAAADGVWRRLVTDPTTGALLDYGRSTYRPPTDLADFIRARDITCRFPSCRQPATHCDLDHTTPHPKGATDRSNLGALCRHHHRLKHESDWQLTQSNDGIFTWTSPPAAPTPKAPNPPTHHQTPH